MERVRRRKLCLHLRKGKPYRERDAKNKINVDDKVEKNIVTCNTAPGDCHPYEDTMIFVHALNDVLLTISKLFDHAKWHCFHLYCMTDPVLIHKVLLDKYADSYLLLSVLTDKVFQAAKDAAWRSYAKQQQKVNSQKEGNRNRGIPECGNYLDHAVHLVRLTKIYLAKCSNGKERAIHLKKLKLFQAFIKLQEIRNSYEVLPNDPTDDEDRYSLE